MLQKLPKTAGDSITLGTPVAVGICPSDDKKTYTSFVSFERGGELISYEMVGSRDVFMYRLMTLAASVVGKSDPPRADVVCRVIDKAYELIDHDGKVFATVDQVEALSDGMS